MCKKTCKTTKFIDFLNFKIKKKTLFVFIYPVSNHKIDNRYKYIKKKGE